MPNPTGELTLLLAQYQYVKGALQELKDEEMALRMRIINEFETKEEGQKTTKYEDGDLAFSVTTKGSLYRNIDKEAFYAIRDELSDDELEAVRYQPEIVKSHYDGLPVDSALREVVTVKAGTPSLAVSILPAKKD